MKIIVSIAVVIALLIGGSLLTNYLQASSDPDMLAKRGLHWHPELVIYVKGEKVDIPQNIGLSAVHQPMHTHKDLPIIHLEFDGIVRRGDVVLGQFFKNWGKDMRSFGANMRMTVNGQTNTEYENYMMHDKDKIELRYD